MDTASRISENSKIKDRIKLAVGFLLLFCSAVAVVVAMWQLGIYGSGNDMWGHLFKAQVMYDGIQEGQFYPLYTLSWYNGIQPYRYWPPLPYYIMAGLQMLTSRDLEWGYYLFAGISVFFGGIPWILLGKKYHRVNSGVMVALLWFFMPENIRVFYCEGNLPRMVTAILIPWLIYYLWMFVREKKTRALIGIMLFMMAMVLSHAMIAAMMGVGTFLFLLFDFRKNHSRKEAFVALCAMLCGIMLAGIWLIPALSGGLVGMGDTSSVMESLMYDLTSTLNPVNRLTGVIDTFYYGLSVVIISVAGIFLADRKKKAGYIVALIVLICTTPAMLPILRKLPLSQLFWMMRFATIVYGFFFFSFLEWTKMKKKVCVICFALIVIDCIPSFMLRLYDTPASVLVENDVDTVKELTSQRTSFMDLSAYGSYPSFGLNQGEDGVDYTYGWAWQGAATSSNIVLLNTALEDENYLYVFDRSLELGNDTVLIRKDLVGKNNKTKKDMVEGALESGYTLAKETNNSYIFVLNKEDGLESFGVKTTYLGLAIGSYANTVSLYYPEFTVGISEYIDDYTEEELASYQTLFLSGFSYHDRETAENLLERLSDDGVRVVIDMTHVPSDIVSKRQEFLGVTAEDISFDKNYPDTYFEEEKVLCKDFGDDYDTWNTSYLYGVEKVLGYMDYYGEKLTFAGYNEEHANIIYLGMNMMFHATETEDESVFNILSQLLQISYMKLPIRTLVPMTIEYDDNQLTIDCDETGVNSTLAYQDNFESEDDIVNENHLLIINKKHTVIQVVYPKLKQGLAVSILGMAAGSILVGVYYGRKRKPSDTECSRAEK